MLASGQAAVWSRRSEADRDSFTDGSAARPLAWCRLLILPAAESWKRTYMERGRLMAHMGPVMSKATLIKAAPLGRPPGGCPLWSRCMSATVPLAASRKLPETFEICNNVLTATTPLMS